MPLLTIEPQELSSWEVLSSCDASLLETIRLVKFFGDKGDSVMMVTESDRVYIVGKIPPYFLQPEESHSKTPQEIAALSNKGVVGLASGLYHWLTLTGRGEVFAWGLNWSGQLGLGSRDYKTTPTAVPDLPEVADIACGAHFSLALTKGGEVYAWGGNDCGQCGKDNQTPHRVCDPSCRGDTLSPSRVEFPGDVKVTSITCGWLHAGATSSDGKIYCWGSNDWGQLGSESCDGYSWQPAAVSLGREARETYCGQYHTLALTSDGLVWAWGRNTRGRLGVGLTDRPVRSPRQVEGLESVTSIMALWRYSLSLAHKDSNGFVWGAFHPLSKDEVTAKPLESSVTSVLANRETPTFSVSSSSLKSAEDKRQLI